MAQNESVNQLLMKKSLSNPINFLFLALPYGMSNGFIAVTLPFILTQNGFSVAEAATITAIGLSASLWRLLWTPIMDLTLSLHKWYLIGLVLSAVSLCTIGLIPIELKFKTVFMIVVFISQIASTFSITPVGGFMAKTVSQDKKGRASGWYQSGNLGGTGIGGGLGLWISDNCSPTFALTSLAVIMLLCSIILYFVPQVFPEKGNIKTRFKHMVIDVKDMFKSNLSRYSMILILTPIGIGAAANLWSSIADVWKVNTDTIAIVTGGLSAGACILGCIAGGWIADKIGRWWAYFGAGGIMALVSLLMALSPYTPTLYVIGVLLYAFSTGIAFAAFSAVGLHIIRGGLASTKYAVFTTLGNIAPVYMVATNGWIYDSYGTKTMLLSETFLGFIFITIFLVVLSRLRSVRILS